MTPYIGEITLVGINFAPVGWAFCDGSLLSITQNTALYTLVGTQYGGDGVNTFALPNLQSRVPVHQGNGYLMGVTGGVESVTLGLQQMPLHTHSLVGTGSSATSRTPTKAVLAMPDRDVYTLTDEGAAFNGDAIGVSGGNQSHSNLQPYLAITYIIALFGVFPSQG